MIYSFDLNVFEIKLQIGVLFILSFGFFMEYFFYKFVNVKVFEKKLIKSFEFIIKVCVVVYIVIIIMCV